MKKVVFILCLLISFQTIAFTQNKSSLFSDIKTGPNLSYQEILFIKLSELLSYKEGFKYYNEVANSNFTLKETDNEIYLNIFGASSEKLRFNILKVVENGLTFNFLELENESAYINNDIALKKINENSLPDKFVGNNFSQVNYIPANAIIVDREICNFDQNHNYGKILNRSVTSQHLVTSNNQQCQLYGDVNDGAMITYSINGSIYTKIISADNIWSRITWYDETLGGTSAAQSLGSQGSGTGQFSGPSAIAVAGPYANNNQNIYNIYVADQLNGRIVLLNYYVTPTCWMNCQDYINGSSFFPVKWIDRPYDVEVHAGINNGTTWNDSQDDILWITQDLGSHKQLKSCWACCGGDINTVTSFTYRNQTLSLNPTRISVYRSPDGSTNL